MANSINASDIVKLAQSLIKENTEGKDYMLSEVYNMTRQAYDKHPEDTVIRQFSFVIEQMIEKNAPSTIITQAKMTKIYNDLVRLSSETKFRMVLGELVMPSNLPKTANNNDFISHNRVDADDSSLSAEDFVDKGLVGALNVAFGGEPLESTYNADVAKKGAQYVEVELESLGFSPKVDIMGGDVNTVVYAAHFDTREGLVTVAIPLDVSSGHLLFPSTFVAGNKLESLESNKLSYFIDKKATSKDFSVPDAKKIAQSIAILTGKVAQTSEDDFSNVSGMFGEGNGELVFEDSIPQESNSADVHFDATALSNEAVEMPQELAHLAHDFENDLLEAVSSFGQDAIRRGKSVVLAELAAAGFKRSQIKFGSEGNDGVIYLAAIYTPKGPVEIEVPVDMKKGASGRYDPLLPSYFAYDGVIEDFEASRLQRFAMNLPAPSTGNVVCSTAHSYMTLPELKDELIKSASKNDYVECEMVLGTIQDRFEEEDYNNAVADYHNVLMIKSASVNTQHKCGKEIPAGKGSIYSRCGHHLVSMDKVVVGEDGHCRLKTAIERERLNPIDESGSAISTSKLFWS